MPGDLFSPGVLAALQALRDGNGDGFDLHIAVGGVDAVRDLGCLALAAIDMTCTARGAGDPGELLADMLATVLARGDGG